MSQISQSAIHRLINETEASFAGLWETLALARKGLVSRDQLLEFQPILGECLFLLARANAALKRERDRLVARKPRLNSEWFTNRLRRISALQLSLREVVTIGQTLGDAFAWVWYSHTPELLREHRRHPSQVFFPHGKGGETELEVVRKMQVTDGYFTIHHSLTSMLRLGDVSLVDMRRRRVVAIGEIKLSHTDGNIATGTLRMIFRAGSDVESFATHDAAIIEAEPMPLNLAQRLEKQSRAITQVLETVKIPDITFRSDVGVLPRLNDLKHLLKNIKPRRFTTKATDGGLVLGAYFQTERTLYGRIQGVTNLVEDEINEFILFAWATAIPGSSFNRLRIGTLHYDKEGLRYLDGGTPLPLWPIDHNLLRMIIFKKVTVLVAYNDSYLVRALEARGFTILPTASGDDYALEKRVGDTLFRMESVDYFFELAAFHLYSEEQIVRILESTAEKSAEVVERGVATKVNLAFRHRF